MDIVQHAGEGKAGKLGELNQSSQYNKNWRLRWAFGGKGRSMWSIPLRSPGNPAAAGHNALQLFLTIIASGMSSGAVAIKAGVSQIVGTRWFREAGGMPPIKMRAAALLRRLHSRTNPLGRV